MPKIWSLIVLQIEQMINFSFFPLTLPLSVHSKAASPGMAGHLFLAKDQVLHPGNSGHD